MASKVYIIRHHIAWRTRSAGKLCGDYPSREDAVRSAVARDDETGQDIRDFSYGIVGQFRVEWHS